VSITGGPPAPPPGLGSLAPTERFSSRVENYVRYRPSYPREIVTLLARDHGLTLESCVADVGSGTGFFARLFLQHGNEVYGVEPNLEMRQAGEHILARFPLFHSVAGTAEATTLLNASVDFVTAAQAFHWFDRDRTRAEFSRILRPGGRVVLAWNDRQLHSSPFLEAYEDLLHTFGTDYAAVVQAECGDDVIASFFAGGELRSYVVPNRQVFDRDGLRGRLLSSSYAPEEAHPSHAPMLAALDDLFDRTQRNGLVSFDYDTRIYCGRLPAVAG
jgi:SAM-dependent methyltransferase